MDAADMLPKSLGRGNDDWRLYIQFLCSFKTDDCRSVGRRPGPVGSLALQCLLSSVHPPPPGPPPLPPDWGNLMISSPTRLGKEPFRPPGQLAQPRAALAALSTVNRISARGTKWMQVQDAGGASDSTSRT